MFEPGYYKWNHRALRLREMVRWYGWRRGFWAWLKSRFMPAARRGRWMPGLWSENECTPEALSADFWQATKPHRADFEKLGFVQCHLTKPKKSLDPMARDCGGIFYLDPTRCYIGILTYSQYYSPEKNKLFNYIILAFTAMFESRSFSCTNNRLAFDSATGGEVVRMKSYDVTQIYNRFREELKQREDKPRPFADVEAVRQWFDARQIKNFEDHVRRRLFVPMSESEIAAAEAEMQRFGPGRPLPPPRRRRFRLEFMPTAFAVILLAMLFMQWHRHGSVGTGGNTIAGDTIDYGGQHFKMRLPYDSYEDYKDDPDNLNTNELGRIEQTMEAVKVPATFKDRDDFDHFMFFELEFPGYGWGGIDASVQTDDGSTLELASADIPQRDKDRVLVVRKEPGGRLNLVDDFIYANDETNSIERVKLEHGQLKYFDENGRLVRKKSI
jgi:hypothetical protein